jgi:hypothetical protein
MSYISSISRSDSCRTNTPLFGTAVTRPWPASTFKASRIGPRLVPMRSASAASFRRSPGWNSPL